MEEKYLNIEYYIDDFSTLIARERESEFIVIYDKQKDKWFESAFSFYQMMEKHYFYEIDPKKAEQLANGHLPLKEYDSHLEKLGK